MFYSYSATVVYETTNVIALIQLSFASQWMQSTMSATIVNPAICEVRAVIRFLGANGSSAAQIHKDLCFVFGPTAAWVKE